MRGVYCEKMGFIMLGAVTAEAAGRITNGSYSWASAVIYLVVAALWFGAALVRQATAR